MYTYFDKTKKVLAVLQIVDDATLAAAEGKPVMPHNETKEDEDVLNNDSHDGNNTSGGGGTTAIRVTGVNITSATSLTLDSGISETGQITYEVLPVDATDKSVTFTSSDDTIASVDATGLVTAQTAGNATITVTTTDGGFTATVTVDVT